LGSVRRAVRAGSQLGRRALTGRGAGPYDSRAYLDRLRERPFEAGATTATFAEWCQLLRALSAGLTVARIQPDR